MRKRLIIVSACAGVAVAATVAVADFSTPMAPERQAISYPEGVVSPDLRQTAPSALAQAYGTRCASTVGICPIDPAPIGFYCQCGPYPGSVIP